MRISRTPWMLGALGVVLATLTSARALAQPAAAGAHPFGVGHGAGVPTLAYRGRPVAADCATPFGCGVATCPPAGCTAACGPPPAVWGVALGPLLLARDDSSHFTFSYDDPNEDLQYLDQRDADLDFGAGFEAQLTRYDPCARCGLELAYWRLFPGDQEARVLGADLSGNLSAILNFNQLDYNGATADNSTNNATAHRLRRSSDLSNIEANRFLVFDDPRRCQPGGAGSRVSTLVGLRLFRFDEDLQFASDPNDAVFDGDPDELRYDIDVDNFLVGLQVGGYYERPLTRRCSLVAGGKAGVFANFASGDSHIGGSAGTAVINNGPNSGRLWRVENDKTGVATIAEITGGVTYRLSTCWRVSVDYRLMGVSGLALPANQIYPDLRGINDVELLHTSGEVFLHGGGVRLERFF